MPSQGTTHERGYDYAHKKLRKQYERTVAAGKATCWRCNQPIAPAQPWDLGHADERKADGSRDYRGPEHIACNRATNGRGHALTGPPVDTSRAW